jgi:hypothetical protein
MKVTVIIAVVFQLVFTSQSVSQILSDDKLYEVGYNELQNRNWTKAGAYLFAFIQRNPVDFVKDKVYAKQVAEAFDASLKNVEKNFSDMRNEIASKDAIIADLKRQLKIPTSSSSAITVEPPIPTLKKPKVSGAKTTSSMIIRQEKPLEGEWQATLTSSTGTVFYGSLLIALNADLVSGTLTMSDNTGTKVTGMFDGRNFILLRNTGRNTMQTYTLTKIDQDHYSGTYKNDGNSVDNGKIEISRSASK